MPAGCRLDTSESLTVVCELLHVGVLHRQKAEPEVSCMLFVEGCNFGL